MLYSVYALFSVWGTWCIVYFVYGVLGIWLPGCIMHSVYAVLSVNSRLWHEGIQRDDFALYSAMMVELCMRTSNGG